MFSYLNVKSDSKTVGLQRLPVKISLSRRGQSGNLQSIFLSEYANGTRLRSIRQYLLVYRICSSECLKYRISWCGKVQQYAGQTW